MFRTCGHSLELRFLCVLRKTANFLNRCKFNTGPRQGQLSTASDQETGSSPCSKFNRQRGGVPRPEVLPYLAHSFHLASVIDNQLGLI